MDSVKRRDFIATAAGMLSLAPAFAAAQTAVRTSPVDQQLGHARSAPQDAVSPQTDPHDLAALLILIRGAGAIARRRNDDAAV